MPRNARRTAHGTRRTKRGTLPELTAYRSTPERQRPSAYLLWVQLDELAKLETPASEIAAPMPQTRGPAVCPPARHAAILALL